MRFVKNQKRAGAEVVEPVTEWRGVGFVNQQLVGDEETRKGRPRIHAISAFLADAVNIGAVENFKGEAEAGFKFFLPLQKHRGWTGHDNFADATAQEEFARDERGLDGFAEA